MSAEMFAYAVIGVEAVAIALLVALVRSFGRLAAASVDPALLRRDGSLSSRILRGLLTPSVTGGSSASPPSRSRGASSSPSLRDALRGLK